MNSVTKLLAVGVILLSSIIDGALFAQAPKPEEAEALTASLKQLQQGLESVRNDPAAENYLADVGVYAKAADWILRHNEFYKPEYVQQTEAALKTGMERAAFLLLGKGRPSWDQTPGKKILGYQSAVDNSFQPYALTLPTDFDKKAERRWPLHVVLHGRGATLNEVNFIHQHDGKPAQPSADWIQLDVFGRTNNAYRFAGETDVFEAMADVRRRYRIDELRIVLHGYSMGGAGSWHLGLHYPSLWCSVGPGAGFVNFYKYQKVTEPLPPYQDKLLSIYNPIDYTSNAFNVPICTYGGENDEQLVASTEMVAKASELGLSIKMLIGPGVGHAFHPETQKEFMAFHAEKQKLGRLIYPENRSVKFTTHTVKYNNCDWVTIEEMIEPYAPATVDAEADDDGQMVKVTTKNVGVLALGRDLGEKVMIDGDELPLANAAQGLLPNVYFELTVGHWIGLNYNQSLAFPKNTDLHKRHNVQGPIDDAFMQPFVCVRGTGTPWNEEHETWARWTLDRFDAEFDKWMRGRVIIVDDKDLTDEIRQTKNLILFGDPGSNSVMAEIVGRLPIQWSETELAVFGEKYDPSSHGLAMIYPNPMNPRKYIVLNSGHTFHAGDFEKSNAWLFPRLGDIAVQKFEKQPAGGYQETVVKADIFTNNWMFSRKK